MNNKYVMNDFQFMNKSNFNLSIGSYKFNTLQGIDRILDQVEHYENREDLRESLFRVFIDNKSKRYEKLYLDKNGDIDFDIVVSLVE